MRSLAQPKVLLHAGMAALITSLACCPRLGLWLERPHALLFLWLLMLWSAFVLWAFVFAWHAQYTGLKPFAFQGKPRVWALTTLGGLAAAALLHYFYDPWHRAAVPNAYPADIPTWLAMALFTLAFNPLFLCFAPFAFFIRLCQRLRPSIALTVLFDVFVLFLQLTSAKELPPPWLTFELMAGTVGVAFLTLYLYLNGGAWPVWWLLLVAQSRHLPELLRGN